MPDLDIIGRSLSKAWREPYRLMKGGAPEKLVGESLVKALAATLRDEEGIPGFEPLLAATMQAQSARGDARSLAEVSRFIEQEFGQRQGTKVLARAAQRNMAQIDAGLALPGPLPFSQECLRSLLRHHFFAKINGRLLGKKGCFADVQRAREFEAGVWSSIEPQLARLARSLTLDPTASKLRAPASRMSRHTTAELIDMPLPGGGPRS